MKKLSLLVLTLMLSTTSLAFSTLECFHNGDRYHLAMSPGNVDLQCPDYVHPDDNTKIDEVNTSQTAFVLKDTEEEHCTFAKDKHYEVPGL